MSNIYISSLVRLKYNYLARDDIRGYLLCSLKSYLHCGAVSKFLRSWVRFQGHVYDEDVKLTWHCCHPEALCLRKDKVLI